MHWRFEENVQNLNREGFFPKKVTEVKIGDQIRLFDQLRDHDLRYPTEVTVEEVDHRVHGKTMILRSTKTSMEFARNFESGEYLWVQRKGSRDGDLYSSSS